MKSDKHAPSLAVAYSVQRKNKKPKAGPVRADKGEPTADRMQFAEGGEVRAGSEKPTADSGQDHACTYMCNNNKHYDKDGSLVRAGSERPSADSDQSQVSPTPKNNASGSLVRAASERPTADKDQRDSAPGRPKVPGTELVRAGSQRPAADEDQDDAGLNMYAEGGDVEGESDDHHTGTMADMIAKRLAHHMHKMAKGGEVGDRPIDRDNNATEQDNYEDDLSFDALGKKVYDDEQLSDQPMDSNETGDEEEKDSENKHDQSLISAIRKRLSSKKA